MNQYKKLFNDSIVFAIGSFGSKLITFFLVGFYTYYLSKSEYGTADLLINSVNLLLPVVSLSVSEGVLRFVLDSKNTLEKVSWLRTAIRINFFGTDSDRYLCVSFLSFRPTDGNFFLDGCV